MDFKANSLKKSSFSKPKEELPLEDSTFSSNEKSFPQDLNLYENLIDLNASSPSYNLPKSNFSMQPSGFDFFDKSSFGCLTTPSYVFFHEPKSFEIHGGFSFMDNFNTQNGWFLGSSQRTMPINFFGPSVQCQSKNQNPYKFIELTPIKNLLKDEGSSTNPKNDIIMVPTNLSNTTITMVNGVVTSDKKKTQPLVKRSWTSEEDSLLMELVERYGKKKWSLISQSLNGRIGKQCRERWTNHLKPNIKKDGWSEEEDLILIHAHAEIGNRWAEIAKRLPGRTENSIKNHWNATMRKQLSKRKYKIRSLGQNTLLQEYINHVITHEDQNTTIVEPIVTTSSTSNSPPLSTNGDSSSNNATRVRPGNKRGYY